MPKFCISQGLGVPPQKSYLSSSTLDPDRRPAPFPHLWLSLHTSILQQAPTDALGLVMATNSEIQLQGACGQAYCTLTRISPDSQLHRTGHASDTRALKQFQRNSCIQRRERIYYSYSNLFSNKSSGTWESIVLWDVRHSEPSIGSGTDWKLVSNSRNSVACGRVTWSQCVM